MNSINRQYNVALEASAGTGKTFQLSMRVAAMLISGVSPKDILCLTFTNKAANEMLERILNILDSASKGLLSENEQSLLEHAVKIDISQNNDKDNNIILKSMAEVAKNRLLANFSDLKVKTIDAFFNLILKVFPFEAGIRPDYKICSEDIENELTDDAFYIVMQKLLTRPEWETILEKIPDTFEISSIQLIDKLKTFAIFSAKRHIYIKNSIKNSYINAEKINKHINEAAKYRKEALISVQNFVNNIDSTSLDKRQNNIYNKLLKIKKIKEIVKETFLQKSSPNEHSYFKNFDFTSSAYNEYEKIKNNTSAYLITYGKVAKELSFILGKLLYTNLKDIKNMQNLMTHNDICEKAYEILVEDSTTIDKNYIYFRLDGKINHILIDEFQDTSHVQWLVLRPLVEEAMSGIGQYDKNGSFFYVGDPKQNLYRFRGGSVHLFRTIAKIYNERLLKETLSVNYRSDKNIVEFVNKLFSFIANNYSSKNQDLSIFNINQKAVPNSDEGYVEVSSIKKDSSIGKKSSINFAVEQVKKAAKNGWKYRDIAILVTTNKIGLEIKFGLYSEGIPVRLETSSKLVDTGIFRVITALAEYMETGSDFSFLECAFTERFLINGNDYANKIKRSIIAEKIKVDEKYSNNTIFERLICVIKKTGIQERFKNEPDFHLTLDVIARYAANEKNISVFLETVRKAAAEHNSVIGEHSNAVTIMTLHKSKGLQFPMVILPNLKIDMHTSAKGEPFVLLENDNGYSDIEYIHDKNSEIFLNNYENNALNTENDLCFQDALNRLYVAVTRAEKALIIGLEESKNSKSENIENFLIDTLGLMNIHLPYIVGSLRAPAMKEKLPAAQNYDIKIKPIDIGEKQPIQTEDKVDFNSAIFGTVFHKAAFLLNGFTDEAVDNALKNALSSTGTLISKTGISEIKKYLQLLANSKEWQKLFKGHVFRERKLAKDEALYSVDFYSVFSNEIILIDYKTGEISDDQKEQYKEQLLKYETILKEIYNRPVKSHLYHFHKNTLKVTSFI